MAYKNFYISKTSSGSTVFESVAKWNIYCKEFPFQMSPEAKELYSNDWKDEDGEDVYFPTDRVKAKAYDMQVEFAYKGAVDTANARIKAFIEYLYGRDSSGTEIKLYDDYTKIGRTGLYVKSIDPTIVCRHDKQGDVFTFKVTFRVTDPLTDITLSV